MARICEDKKGLVVELVVEIVQAGVDLGDDVGESEFLQVVLDCVFAGDGCVLFDVLWSRSAFSENFDYFAFGVCELFFDIHLSTFILYSAT